MLPKAYEKRMCLDMLDPCKICKWTFRVVGLLVLFFIGGYILKGVYLHANMDDTGDVALHDVLLDKNFWIPDGYFWVLGLVGIVLLFVGVAILRGLFMGLVWLLHFLCCRLCCRSCNSSDLEAGESDLHKKPLVGKDDVTKEG